MKQLIYCIFLLLLVVCRIDCSLYTTVFNCDDLNSLRHSWRPLAGPRHESFGDSQGSCTLPTAVMTVWEATGPNCVPLILQCGGRQYRANHIMLLTVLCADGKQLNMQIQLRKNFSCASRLRDCRRTEKVKTLPFAIRAASSPASISLMSSCELHFAHGAAE